jgi:hypothetical protein
MPDDGNDRQKKREKSSPQGGGFSAYDSNPYGKPVKGESPEQRLLREQHYYHWQQLEARKMGDTETLKKIYAKQGEANIPNYEDPAAKREDPFTRTVGDFAGKNQVPTAPRGSFGEAMQGGENLANSPIGMGLIGTAGMKGLGQMAGGAMNRMAPQLQQLASRLGPQGVARLRAMMGMAGGAGAAGGREAEQAASEAPKPQAGARPPTRVTTARSGTNRAAVRTTKQTASNKKYQGQSAPRKAKQAAPEEKSTPAPSKTPSPTKTPKPQRTAKPSPAPSRSPAPAKTPSPAKTPKPSASASPSASMDQRRKDFEEAKKKVPRHEGEDNKTYNRRVAAWQRENQKPAGKTTKTKSDDRAPRASKTPNPDRTPVPAEAQARRDAAQKRTADWQKANPRREGETKSEYNKRSYRAALGQAGGKVAQAAKRAKAGQKAEEAKSEERDKRIQLERGNKPGAPAGVARAHEKGLDADYKKFQGFKADYAKKHPKATDQEIQKAWRAHTGAD